MLAAIRFEITQRLSQLIGETRYLLPLSEGATLYTHLLGSYKRQLDVQKSVVLSLL